ncbi:MAG: hypothetical protein JW957_02915 [Candidatus Omnitrophica bacterium]|nr:hypothetical protein [Candidatus Omnitrophota bacterium]
MKNTNSFSFDRIKKLGVFSTAFPFIILAAGILVSRKGMPALVDDYDQGIARILQYVLFGIGVVIFFFCDGISDFFTQRLFVRDGQRNEENLSSYFAYTFIMLWLLNTISVMGFFGFLICGNLTWLTVFVLLNLSLQIRYFPSQGKFNRLLETVKK